MASQVCRYLVGQDPHQLLLTVRPARAGQVVSVVVRAADNFLSILVDRKEAARLLRDSRKYSIRVRRS